MTTRLWKRSIAALALTLTAGAGLLTPLGHTQPAHAGPVIGAPNAPVFRYRLPAGNFYTTTFIFAAVSLHGTAVGLLGFAFPTQKAGTIPLYDCAMGNDYFNSLSSSCEGQTVHGVDGYVFANPVGIAIYRCWNGTYHLTTTNTACDNQPGYRLEGPLGWLTSEAFQH